MDQFHQRARCAKGRRVKRERLRFAAPLLCLLLLAGFLPALAQAVEGEEAKLSAIVTFGSINLHYAESNAVVEDRDLLEKDKELILRYTYSITTEQCPNIMANTRYYLEVSPHLTLTHLEEGSPLTIETGNGKVPFGKIYSNGSKAWVIFDAKKDSENNDTEKTILSDFGELNDAYFYLNCTRAGEPPEGEPPIEGHSNLYAMKFENGDELHFGYAEHEPVTAAAKLSKDGLLQDKTITWTINYTPCQNPSEDGSINPDTPFELRDTIDSSLHEYVHGSIKIDEHPITCYTSRSEIPPDAETYALIETPEGKNSTTLIFGGTKFKAGTATQANPAKPLVITYDTDINADLLLPGGTGGKRIKNAADLFAQQDGIFNSLDISSSHTLTIPQPKWMEKTGTTTRDPGNGSTTDWTVTFYPNGFTFAEDNALTLQDQLPTGSTLVENSVKVNGTAAAAEIETETGTNQSFTVSGIETDKQTVTITYQTHVPEEMYDSGTNLGSNTAWFTFQYNDQDYTVPKVTTPVGSGDGTGTPGTEPLVKSNTGYHAKNRSIHWTVKINPHQAYLKGGTFVDDLKLGTPCSAEGHGYGLELVNRTNGIAVLVDGKEPSETEKGMISLAYDDQKITVTVGEIGAKTITLSYTTKVCDPCLFANNAKASFQNKIATDDMIVGSQSTTERSASASSTANISAAVLEKKAPVYDYADGVMHWSAEVDAAGLPMTGVVLTDTLPRGLSYVDRSLNTSPQINDASASADGQELTITLGTVTEKTTVTFDTKVDPELLGFSSNAPVVVENTIRMNGAADGVPFLEVSHRVEQSFSNHGLVKSSAVNNQDELIRYEVLINPYGLALPDRPSLVDTLDKRLQLDTDTLRFYPAVLSGTSGNAGQKPAYTKSGEGQPLKISSFDPNTNSFTVPLPIESGSRDAYVLTYTADIVDHQAGGYSNRVHFDGGSVLLGGDKANSANVGGGGGGGGGGVAARKAVLSLVKTDRETKQPLSGAAFLLYQLDGDTRLPFAQGKTDAQGRLSFKVKPGGVYELVETEGIPGYQNALGWEKLPEGVTETDGGLRITAGAAKTELTLALTNEALSTDIVFRLVNADSIPIAGQPVKLFSSDPAGQPEPVPAAETTVSPDGMVRFPGIRRNASCFIQLPGGECMTIDFPAGENELPMATFPDGTTAELTGNNRVTGTVPKEQQWTAAVKKVVSGSDTPLAGAQIGLYADADCQLWLATAVSDADGTVTFPGLIQGQSYWLKESQAPDGYLLNPDTYPLATETAVIIPNSPTPENPDDTDDPEKPEDPDKPVDPVDPEDPDKPDEDPPEDPGGSASSGGSSGRPHKPVTPSEPIPPSEPAAPIEPITPIVPEDPAEPAIEPEPPAQPGTSIGPAGEAASQPEPAGSRAVNALLDALHIPRTADNAQLLLKLLILFSGAALAGLMACRLHRRKKKRRRG